MIMAGLIVAFVIGWQAKPDPPRPGTPRVIPPRVVVEEKPDPEIRWLTRIVEREVPIESTGTAETVASTDLLDEFIEATQDSTAPVRFLEYAFDYGVDGRETLRLWGIRSDRLEQLDRREGVTPPFRGGWSADSSWVREDRFHAGVEPEVRFSFDYPIHPEEASPRMRLDIPLRAYVGPVSVAPYVEYEPGEGEEIGISGEVDLW